MAETLTIKIGPSPSKLIVCNPNDEENPIHVKNAEFEGDVLIRVANFRGVVPDDAPGPISTIPYFEGRSRKMSFQFQGRFAREWTADDLVWSQDWDAPLAAPTMIGLFTKFWKMTDPGSFSEINSPTPFMRSYVATAMCSITSWKPVSDVGDEPFRPVLVEDINGLLSQNAIIKARNAPLTTQLSALSVSSVPNSGPASTVNSESGFPGSVINGAETTGGEVSEVTGGDAVAAENMVAEMVAQEQGSALPAQTIASKFSFPKRVSPQQKEQQQKQLQAEKESKLIEKVMKGGEDSVKDRRKFFAIDENRKETVFKPDTVYGFEVFNPYFDPNEFKIKIPGVSIDLHKVTNGQPMRLRLMSKDGQTVFFVVEVSAQPPPPAAEGTTTSSRLGGMFNRLTGGGK
ncbi:hypothetical protein BC830DRAFT_1119280 [Chytriomyces sp. MP71]|nr:hypothetical protein BC830DRAFT_1119280 [Chytriomyces sp. MP71]